MALQVRETRSRDRRQYSDRARALQHPSNYRGQGGTRPYSPPRRRWSRFTLALRSSISPLAACVRELMAERGSWRGSAADLLRIGADRSNGGIADGGTGWPKNPRGLAGRLRRAQTFLRALGIEVAFSREGRAGSKVIRIGGTQETTVCTVGGVSITNRNSAQDIRRPDRQLPSST